MLFVFTQHAKDGRLPASLPKTKVFDFTQLEQGQNVTLRKHILNKSEAVADHDRFGIRVGHFMVRNSSGQTEGACDMYDSVTYTFEAEGMAVNGERPKLVLSGKCHSQNESSLEPLWIPVGDLVKRPAGNMDYSLNDADQTNVHFEDMDMVWPKHWVLSGVKFQSHDPATTPLTMDRLEVYKYSRTPLVMYWKF